MQVIENIIYEVNLQPVSKNGITITPIEKNFAEGVHSTWQPWNGQIYLNLFSEDWQNHVEILGDFTEEDKDLFKNESFGQYQLLGKSWSSDVESTTKTEPKKGGRKKKDA